MEYHKETGFFHSFECDGYMAGFSFVLENEAKLFYEKVQFCISTHSDRVYEDFHDKRELTSINVGDNFVSSQPKDGRQLQWSKPAPTGDLAKELGATVVSIAPGKKKDKIIDLIANPQPLIPENVAKFEQGNNAIQDGTTFSWKKNSLYFFIYAFKFLFIVLFIARTLADLENEMVPKTQTPEELNEILDGKKHRIKHLEQKRKEATAAGDNATARGLKQKIDEEKKAIKQIEDTLGKKGIFKMFKWK